MLFPVLTDPPDRPAVRVGQQALSHPELATAVATLAPRLPAHARVAVLVGRDLDTVVAVIGALVADAQVVPVNAGATDRELAHLVGDCGPDLVLHPAGVAVPAALAAVPHLAVDAATLAGGTAPPALARPRTADVEPGLVMYTSGTTGPPKGAVLSHAAIAANLDGLAAAWAWTDADVLTHALPLYHVHGLVLGVLGAVRVGGALHHTALFRPETTIAALRPDAWAGGATMHFGVPTIYARLADAAEDDPAVAAALASARLLVSGSAGLPASVHQRIERLTGQVIVERYGMTETMITTAVPAGVRHKAGTVGRALPGVSIRLVDEAGAPVASDGESMGEIEVRTPSMFDGYLGRPDATAACQHDGWFVTGDIATVDADGYVRIIGRRSSDIIKSGGFKIGAGEIEDALLEHPAVLEAAVRGVADDDLGERVEAWVVLRADADAGRDDLLAHTTGALAAHKRPRAIHVVAGLPRNGMGKVQKQALEAPPSA